LNVIYLVESRHVLISEIYVDHSPSRTMLCRANAWRVTFWLWGPPHVWKSLPFGPHGGEIGKGVR
jgi:hypothetical protein